MGDQDCPGSQDVRMVVSEDHVVKLPGVMPVLGCVGRKLREASVSTDSRTLHSMSDRHEHPITDGIRRAIRDDGRTPFELAKLVGIVPQQLYRFLNGKRGLSLEILDKLALLVGVEISKIGETVQPIEFPVSIEACCTATAMTPSITGLRPGSSPDARPGEVRPRPPGMRGAIDGPMIPVLRHPDGRPYTPDDYSRASDEDYRRRMEAGAARREGHERRKKVKKLGVWCTGVLQQPGS